MYIIHVHSDSICSSIRCYSVSEEAGGVHPILTITLKALVVPLGVALHLKRLSEGTCSSVRSHSVSQGDCGAHCISTQHS